MPFAWDNSPNRALTHSTFAFDFREMFTSLVNRVIDTVEDKGNMPQCEFLDSRLVERERCRKIT